jgi:hypothetical protein
MNSPSKTRELERKKKQQERRKKHRKGKAATREVALPPATLHMINL